MLNLDDIDGGNGFQLAGSNRERWMGWSVNSAGDVNADGFDDLIIGAPDDTLNGNGTAGSAYVYFGGPGSALVNHEPTGVIEITGTPLEGQTLSVVSTLADSDGLGEISFQWLANGIPIGGATSDSILLTQDQVDTTISMVAAYTDLRGTVEIVQSGSTAPVED
ncbi:MAG: integrin alpha [Gammaproteobacteria bacterium]